MLEKKKPDDEASKQSDEEEKPTMNQPAKKYNKNNQQQNKRYSKTSTAQQTLKQSNDFNLNSIQCLREAQVPLIQYKNNSNILPGEKIFNIYLNYMNNSNFSFEILANSNQATDSDVSADSSSSSKFYIEKCFAKVRIAAIGVLLTAFQVVTLILDKY